MIRTNYTRDAFDTAANGICPGPDLEWFAIDRDGHVAGFTNAGFGVVPEAVFVSFDRFNETLDAISTLQQTGVAKWAHEKPSIFATWDDWSAHGLFAYDWAHSIGQPDPSLPYRLMCVPEKPIHVSLLPSAVVDYLSQMRFSISFLESSEILVE